MLNRRIVLLVLVNGTEMERKTRADYRIGLLK